MLFEGVWCCDDFNQEHQDKNQTAEWADPSLERKHKAREPAPDAINAPANSAKKKKEKKKKKKQKQHQTGWAARAAPKEARKAKEAVADDGEAPMRTSVVWRYTSFLSVYHCCTESRQPHCLLSIVS